MNINPKAKTTKQLKSNLTKFKVLSILIIASSSALLGVCIYGILMKEETSTFMTLMVIAISCGAILPLQRINIKRIRSELKARNEAELN